VTVQHDFQEPVCFCDIDIAIRVSNDEVLIRAFQRTENRSEPELKSVLDSDLDQNAAQVLSLDFVQRIRKGRSMKIDGKRS
jgi:hypothetical protein